MKKYLILIVISALPFARARTVDNNEWIELFRKKDLATNVELMELEKARLNIKERLGRIIPSLNLGTVVDTAVSGPVGLLSGLSNFVGFLLPSRWFDWQESKMYYLSQYYSYMATRGNLILMAEEIYLSLKKIMKIRGFLHQEMEVLEPLVRSIQFRERIGELPRGSYSRIKSLYLGYMADLKELDFLVEFYLIEMNRLINDSDLDEIDGIDIGPRPGGADGISWNFDDHEDNLVELKSIRSLYLASRYTKKSRAWSVLEPNGEGFGLGYFARNQLATNNLKLVETRKVKLKLELKAKFEAISAEEAFLKQQQLILEEADGVLDSRRHQILVNYRLTGNLDADDYIENQENYLKFKILMESNMISMEYLKAQKERMALVHYYDRLDENIPTRQINKLRRFQRKEDKLIRRHGENL